MTERPTLTSPIQTQTEAYVRDPWNINSSYVFANHKNEIDEIRIRLKFNNFRLINQVFRDCNDRLPIGGFLLGFFEPLAKRKQRLKSGKSNLGARLTIFYDFFMRRFLPKISPFKEWNKRFHIIRNRALSKCELLGRLAFCGFEIMEVTEDDQYCYFKSKKVKEPCYEKQNYGIFVHFPRVGKGGQTIEIYKLRTMYAYAQYLCEYLLKHQGFAQSGKINNDFRIADWGRFLRRFWLDELPQLINIIKGDMRLFGVRPLSFAIYAHYPDDLKKERIKMKPGLIPPYYVDLPKNIEEVFESERRYLELYKKYGFLIDVKFLFIVVYNIVVKGVKSG